MINKFGKGATPDAGLVSKLAKRVAVKAWNVLSFDGQPLDTETFTINDGVHGDKVFEFDNNSSITGDYTVTIGANADITAGNAKDAINTAQAAGEINVTAYIDGGFAGVVFLYAETAGAAGNSMTLAEAATNVTRRAANFIDGADAAVAAIVNIRHIITTYDISSPSGGSGVFRIDTGLTSIDGVYISFEDGGFSKISNVHIEITGGILLIEEAVVAWANNDVLNILVVGTE